MQINLEPRTKNAIQAYDSAQLTIDHIKYQQSLIITPDEIITPWLIESLKQLNDETIIPILNCKPEVIIIGHQEQKGQIPFSILKTLSHLRIGIECMSFGPACRTFNILLSEQRAVVAGIIFSSIT